MRVIAGSARSLPLKTPDGPDTRPTTDRIKETLFNMLQFSLSDSVFVDLFAGSGGIGIEALSRGARKAYFVENAPKAIQCITDNLNFTKFTDRSVVLKQDVFSGINSIFEKEADIIFMDPPYRMQYERSLIEALSRMKYVTENTLLIMEAALDTDFHFVSEYGFTVTKEKQYKTNKHVFIKRKETV